MVESYDVGSLPFDGDYQKLLAGANHYLTSFDDVSQYFEKKIVESFLDEAQAGIDVPNYPQFRDMNEIFFEMIDGLEKTKNGYMETDGLSLRKEKTKIPEVVAINKFSKEISEKIGKKVRLKVCVTGPYTLASSFAYRDKEVFSRIGRVLQQILENNILNEKHLSVDLVSVDEPVFGLLDDPLMDPGLEGRDNLRKSWETIFQKSLSKGAKTCMHLHNTADELFWEIKSLNILESHVDDPLYQSNKTKDHLESTDKFLKASICTTDFDKIIKTKSTATWSGITNDLAINQRVADVWKEINNGKIDPVIFLESADLMKKKLAKAFDKFGREKVPYTGPECGLRGFPTYESALECLKRVSEATKSAIIT